METAEHFDWYLRLLGVEKAPPSAEHLAEVVRAHLMRVPFENLSKLVDRALGRRTFPDLGTYLERIERHNLGGTCYPNGYYLCLLLRHLGYDAVLCGADMSRPDVHLVSRVALDSREYLVDVGYASPFYGPLPRDLPDEHAIAWGNERYVLAPQDAEGRSRVDHYRDGARIHGYVVNPKPRTIGEFDAIVAGSYDDSSNFMNCVRMVRFLPGRSLSLHNLTLVEATPEACEIRTLEDRDELIGVIESRFGVPRDFVEDVVRAVPMGDGLYD